ncbi:hypothetical protein BofuT4_uP099310.1 [Botrytis cinerea T4]|uniref:Uncharacterized protein n=1 Tax=Botryotinia fuckeliana (strain T4) TaxID=999810 RepID=G2YCD4_BOTF4|nr:hypothetical protein BofuT4_uP099310.1 [Botrytis cinerea T4]
MTNRLPSIHPSLTKQFLTHPHLSLSYKNNCTYTALKVQPANLSIATESWKSGSFIPGIE